MVASFSYLLYTSAVGARLGCGVLETGESFADMDVPKWMLFLADVSRLSVQLGVWWTATNADVSGQRVDVVGITRNNQTADSLTDGAAESASPKTLCRKSVIPLLTVIIGCIVVVARLDHHLDCAEEAVFGLLFGLWRLLELCCAFTVFIV